MFCYRNSGDEMLLRPILVESYKINFCSRFLDDDWYEIIVNDGNPESYMILDQI